MIYLTADELWYVAERAIGTPPEVRDIGLLAAAAARPQAFFGEQDAYPDLAAKAAALTHSLQANHALVDGNKRLGLAGLVAFLGVNGHRLTATNDEAFSMIMALASGDIADADELRQQLGPHVEPQLDRPRRSPDPPGRTHRRGPHVFGVRRRARHASR